MTSLTDNSQQGWQPTKYPADEIRSQVVAQCKAVEHMAHVLARVHSDKAVLFAAPPASGSPADVAELQAFIINRLGDETARIMEVLGDILNGMDAVTEDDERFAPIFEESQRLWPSGEGQ